MRASNPKLGYIDGPWLLREFTVTELALELTAV